MHYMAVVNKFVFYSNKILINSNCNYINKDSRTIATLTLNLSFFNF